MYKTLQREITDRWRGIDLPLHEAIEILRAALYLELEENFRARNALERDYTKPPSDEYLMLHKRLFRIHEGLKHVDDAIFDIYDLGLFNRRT